jgi:5'-3' exonuclease
MKLLFFDVSWLAYRAKYAVGKSLGTDDTNAIIFYFLEELRGTCADAKLRSNRVHLFFDSPRSFREEKYPFYKANRVNRTPEDQRDTARMWEVREKLRREVLPACGFPVYRQAGLESDDLIAMAAAEAREDAVIITSDADLYQSISNTVHWYDPSRQLYLDEAGLIARKRVGPTNWADVKCMAGCATDNVPGIPGVGEKTAVDFIWRLPITPKRQQAIASYEGQAIVSRNRELVVLPHKETKSVVLVEPTYNPTIFYSLVADLGFKSIAEGERRRLWDKFFNEGGGLLDRHIPRKRV